MSLNHGDDDDLRAIMKKHGYTLEWAKDKYECTFVPTTIEHLFEDRWDDKCTSPCVDKTTCSCWHWAAERIADVHN